MKRFLTRLTILLLVLGLLGTGVWWYGQNHAQASVSYRTAPVTRGDLVATISATGTVEPEEVVDVGAQVAGIIDALGQDPRHNGKLIDYGTPVEHGTVLAHIDESLYRADVDTAQAQLDQARANVQHAEADLGQMKAKLYQDERNWQRAQQVGPSDALSQNDYDQFYASYEISKANLAVGTATLAQAQKGVAQAAATLRRAQTNLGYCTIKSPVKGVIIDRRVNIGQTVVSSLNAPSLFLIAKDLTRMQVWASVNEADIGNLHPGQPVTFTVDAYLGQVFTGEVGKVRLNASMTQNVVTYTVEVTTDNSSGTLLPYLTANLQFEVNRHQAVVLVPNAALRWYPQPQEVAPDVRAAQAASARGAGGAPEGRTTRGTVWVQDGQFVRPSAVKIGLSDGTLTEIQSAEMQEGTPVIVGANTRESGSNDTTNPFTPQLFNRRPQPPQQ
jgi:HlyD family secretion protein